jgi:hypothetical protein
MPPREFLRGLLFSFGKDDRRTAFAARLRAIARTMVRSIDCLISTVVTLMPQASVSVSSVC